MSNVLVKHVMFLFFLFEGMKHVMLNWIYIEIEICRMSSVWVKHEMFSYCPIYPLLPSYKTISP